MAGGPDVDIIKWLRDSLRPRPLQHPPRFICLEEPGDIRHDRDDCYTGSCVPRFDVGTIIVMQRQPGDTRLGQYRVAHVEWSGNDFKARLEFVKGSM